MQKKQELFIRKWEPADYFISTTRLLNNATLILSSYLGLGLMAARQAVLSMNNPEGATQLASECVNPINKDKKFKYSGIEYLVRSVVTLDASSTMNTWICLQNTNADVSLNGVFMIRWD